jgi:hypothetical protein
VAGADPHLGEPLRTLYLICGIYYKSMMPLMIDCSTRQERVARGASQSDTLYYIDLFGSSQESPSEPNFTASHPHV